MLHMLCYRPTHVTDIWRDSCKLKIDRVLFESMMLHKLYLLFSICILLIWGNIKLKKALQYCLAAVKRGNVKLQVWPPRGNDTQVHVYETHKHLHYAYTYRWCVLPPKTHSNCIMFSKWLTVLGYTSPCHVAEMRVKTTPMAYPMQRQQTRCRLIYESVINSNIINIINVAWVNT